MSIDQLESTMPVVRQIEVPAPVIQNVPSAPIQLDVQSQEQTQAMDQVFATAPQERHTLVDLVTLSAAGMLVHDIVLDTLAAPAEEDEEHPELQPQNPPAPS